MTALKKWMFTVGSIALAVCLGIIFWNLFFGGRSAGTPESASADVGETKTPTVTETEAPSGARFGVNSVDPRIQAVVIRNLSDVGSSRPEVSRLALARIANTGRDGAIVLAHMLRSGDSTIRKNATRALILLRRGGHDIVRMLSSMCTDKMLPASVSVKAMEIITGPDETDEKVATLWEEREGRGMEDYYEPMARRTPSSARTTSSARTVASAVDLRRQKDAEAEAKEQELRINDRIKDLKGKIYAMDRSVQTWTADQDKPMDADTKAWYRGRIEGFKNQLSEHKEELEKAYAELPAAQARVKQLEAQK